MRHPRWVGMIILLGFLVPGIAHARPATQEEAAVLAAASGLNARCGDFRVSELDPSWAAAFRPGTTSGCGEPDVPFLLNHDASSWRITIIDSDGARDWCGNPGPAGEDVVIELGLCREEDTLLISLADGTAEIEPSEISSGFSDHLAGLSWWRWDRHDARATGVLHIISARSRHRMPVRVRASGARWCPSLQRRAFTALYVRAVRPRDRRWLRRSEFRVATYGSCRAFAQAFPNGL